MVFAFITLIVLFIILVAAEEYARWDKEDHRFGCTRKPYKKKKKKD